MTYAVIVAWPWLHLARTVIGSMPIRYGNRLTCRLFAEWLPDTQRHPQQLAAGAKISSPEAYIATIHAVAGQGGHDKTYKAVCYLRNQA